MRYIRKLIQTTCSSAIFYSLAISASAAPKTGHHTLGSAPDVWRVELRDLERFLVMSSGDSDGVSELRKIRVRLRSRDQFHELTESTPLLSINGGRRVWELNVRVGQRVHFESIDDERGIRNIYDLWIHTKERPQGDISFPTLNFDIIVNARELDCAGDNYCRRGDNGEIVYNINLPVPTVRSNRCIPENTYRVTAVNGATMVLRPDTRSREDVTARHKFRDDGPHLAMQSGEICIASTSR